MIAELLRWNQTSLDLSRWYVGRLAEGLAILFSGEYIQMSAFRDCQGILFSCLDDIYPSPPLLFIHHPRAEDGVPQIPTDSVKKCLTYSTKCHQ